MVLSFGLQRIIEERRIQREGEGQGAGGMGNMRRMVPSGGGGGIPPH